ncbi:hypothetical protein Cs308_0759 [Candidatus Chlamydia sanziniae]|uniref:Uncharacterized protein n=2 Tax=Candidatus Chlamydia sanziniae TaxID=1806891 RepID=A0A1A9HVA8_9CHLA|nr:hypothetical protein Cs308_0759 [Candidatus Chlamydia sanziniae]
MTWVEFCKDVSGRLGLNGFFVVNVPPFEKSWVDGCRLIITIIVLCLGLAALVCGIAVGSWGVLNVEILAGAFSFVLGILMIFLAVFWIIKLLPSHWKQVATSLLREKENQVPSNT